MHCNPNNRLKYELGRGHCRGIPVFFIALNPLNGLSGFVSSSVQIPENICDLNGIMYILYIHGSSFYMIKIAMRFKSPAFSLSFQELNGPKTTCILQDVTPGTYVMEVTQIHVTPDREIAINLDLIRFTQRHLLFTL